MTWHDQHLKTLAAISGIAENKARELFGPRVRVTIDPELRENRTFALMFTTAVTLVARLFPNVTFDPLLGSTLTILPWGSGETPAASRDARYRLHVGTDGGDVNVSCSEWHTAVNAPLAARPSEPFNPVLAIASACYGVAALTKLILGDVVTGQTAFPAFSILDFQGGTASFDWDAALVIPNTHLGGVGAIGSAFLYAVAAHGRVAGDLTIVDHDAVDLPNIGRYVLFDIDDVEMPKVTAAVRSLAGVLPDLRVTPVEQLFETYFDSRVAADPSFRIEHLVSCPDRRSTRREWQSRFPRHVYDASTGPDEVVLHTNDYDPRFACMECVYPHVPEEAAHARHVAETLGIDVDRILSGAAIDERDAEIIVSRYPQLRSRELVGRAFDSIFRDLCAAGKLTIDDQVVLAPFPFTSALAGALLYLEFVKRCVPGVFGSTAAPNYIRLNPLYAPNPDFRLQRAARPECRCRSELFRRTFNKIWGIP